MKQQIPAVLIIAKKHQAILIEVRALNILVNDEAVLYRDHLQFS